MPRKRPQAAWTLALRAGCRDCDWSKRSKNAMALAALHYDETGHEVEVKVLRLVRYGGVTVPSPAA